VTLRRTGAIDSWNLRPRLRLTGEMRWRGEPSGVTRVPLLMSRCRKRDSRRRTGAKELTTAKVLAPEDVRAGDYVALLHVVHEIPSFWWCGEMGTIRADEPVRIPFVPNNGGMPYRVRSVCLPFILVKTPSGNLRHLDVRRHRLARLDPEHARAAWKACKKSRHKRERV
jgi:hypothetical protein